jgi:hypothetical protein
MRAGRIGARTIEDGQENMMEGLRFRHRKKPSARTLTSCRADPSLGFCGNDGLRARRPFRAPPACDFAGRLDGSEPVVNLFGAQSCFSR